jgi:hypothetical protein
MIGGCSSSLCLPASRLPSYSRRCSRGQTGPRPMTKMQDQYPRYRERLIVAEAARHFDRAFNSELFGRCPATQADATWVSARGCDRSPTWTPDDYAAHKQRTTARRRTFDQRPLVRVIAGHDCPCGHLTTRHAELSSRGSLPFNSTVTRRAGRASLRRKGDG